MKTKNGNLTCLSAMTFAVLLLWYFVPAVAQTQTNGQDAVSRGDGSKAPGNISTAIGSQVIACKVNSTAFGLRTKAESDNSFVVGRYNVIANTGEGCDQTILIDGAEPLFVVGNGTGPGGPTSEQRKNAFTLLKDGRTIIGSVYGVSDPPGPPFKWVWPAILNVAGNAQISMDLTIGKLSFDRDELFKKFQKQVLLAIGDGDVRGKGGVPSNALTVLTDGRTVVGSIQGKPESIANTSATFSVIGAQGSDRGQLYIVDNENPSTSVNSDAVIIGFGNNIKSGDIGTGRLWYLGSWSSNTNDIGFSNALNGKMIFQTNGTDRVTIDERGDVGIGTPSPGATLEVKAGGTTLADAWTPRSSIRFKENIEPIDHALEKVQQLQGVSYTLKSTQQRSIGLIAEEVGKVLPELVVYESNGKDAKALDYDKLTALLIEAVKDQQKQIEILKARLAAVEAVNN